MGPEMTVPTMPEPLRLWRIWGLLSCLSAERARRRLRRHMQKIIIERTMQAIRPRTTPTAIDVVDPPEDWEEPESMSFAEVPVGLNGVAEERAVGCDRYGADSVGILEGEAVGARVVVVCKSEAGREADDEADALALALALVLALALALVVVLDWESPWLGVFC